LKFDDQMNLNDSKFQNKELLNNTITKG